MPELKKLKLKQFPQAQDRETSEAKFWKSYAITSEEALLGASNCIHFNPLNSSSFLVTSSTRVSIYDSATDKVMRSYTRFHDDAFSAKFRKDGKLFVAGDKSGHVKVFDIQTKAVLRDLKRHTAAVRATVWAADGVHFISGSDDTRVKLWDLSTQEVIWESTKSNAHTDYVRCLDASPISPEIFVSGGYDHAVKIWDSRQASAVHTMTHEAPVETAVISPSGTLLMTSAGNEIKVWDLLSGGKLLHTFCNHQKNITSLHYDTSSSRLMSGGLDGLVKIYSIQTLQVTHGIRFSAPIASMGVSPNGQKLAVGLGDGTLQIRTKTTGNSLHQRGDDITTPLLGDSAESTGRKRQLSMDDSTSELPAGAMSGDEGMTSVNYDFVQNKYYKGAGVAADRIEDGMVDAERVSRLRPFEAHLKKFNYQLALDCALKTKNPLVVITVLEELCFRSGLSIALSGRDEQALEPLLSFIARYVAHPRYSPLLVQIAHKLLDIYSSVLGHSDGIDELFFKLQRQVRSETTFQKQIMRALGSLDCVIQTSIAMTSPLTANEVVFSNPDYHVAIASSSSSNMNTGDLLI